MIHASRLPALFLAAPLAVFLILQSGSAAVDKHAEQTGRAGVAVSYRKEHGVDYVTGQIHIGYSADRVWPILANPYEFEENISPRFKTVAVLSDSPERSLLRCRVELGFFFPAIKYTVESHYSQGRHITFQSIGGDLKSFRGYWDVTPSADGRECDVTYSLHVVPGIPVPQWIVRQGIKVELPHTLIGLRDRIDQIYAKHEHPASRSLAAAGKIYF